MGTLQNYVNKDETVDRESHHPIDLQYKGPLSFLKDKKGDGYFVKDENIWYFKPDGEDEVYRVREENLNFER